MIALDNKKLSRTTSKMLTIETPRRGVNRTLTEQKKVDLTSSLFSWNHD